MARDVKPSSPAPTRRYDSPERRARAAATERRVLDAAGDLFAERGYVQTSLAAVADRAGVNARTVYKIFGTKVRLLDRLVGVAMVGDQAAVAVADRSWAAEAFDAPTGGARVRAFAAVARRVMASAGPVFRVAAQAAVADPDAAALWATGQRLRLEDATTFVGALQEAGLLRPDRTGDDAVATVWLVGSPETFAQLHDGLGWSLDRYEDWIAQTLTDSLLGDEGTG